MPRNLRRLSQQYPEAVGRAMLAEAFAIEAESKKNTPVDTGRLRASHFVVSGFKGSGHRARGAGGKFIGGAEQNTVEVVANTKYAVFVHENSRARHTVGTFKFLEKALLHRRQGMNRRIAKRARDEVRRGIR